MQTLNTNNAKKLYKVHSQVVVSHHHTSKTANIILLNREKKLRAMLVAFLTATHMHLA